MAATALGDNLFGQSLVCVKADTGETRVAFPADAPRLCGTSIRRRLQILADIRVDGRSIKAVVQVTKQGFRYVFDRVTGKPVWPIEERPVPQSTTPENERRRRNRSRPSRPHSIARDRLSTI
jgi:quinoprotein glucose dehydrogenase